MTASTCSENLWLSCNANNPNRKVGREISPSRLPKPNNLLISAHIKRLYVGNLSPTRWRGGGIPFAGASGLWFSGDP